ncbi:MAG: Na+/H+ antiporter subunit E [Xanthomonadales bacterium]|jgi:multicomponent K+:H+ antiporter subunit E|nr:Na+/H+ antiporter subunit E [Xanthomonadales bacterium]
MRRLVPEPLMSLVLLGIWLLLNQSLALGQVLLGALLALAIPWFSERFRPDKPRLRRPVAALRLAGVVLWDVVVANFQLAARILGPESRLRPSYLEVPLDIGDRTGAVVLAGIVTMTPGTLSVELGADGRTLRVHAFDLADASEAVEAIKQRYEKPLMEIFGS